MRSEQRSPACLPISISLSLAGNFSTAKGSNWVVGGGQWRAECQLWTPAPSFLGSTENSPAGQGVLTPVMKVQWDQELTAGAMRGRAWDWKWDKWIWVQIPIFPLIFVNYLPSPNLGCTVRVGVAITVYLLEGNELAVFMLAPKWKSQGLTRIYPPPCSATTSCPS